jgi:hypothetical protein
MQEEPGMGEVAILNSNSPILSITFAGVIIIMFFISIMAMWQTAWMPSPRYLSDFTCGTITIWSLVLLSYSVAKRLGYSIDLFNANSDDKEGSQTTASVDTQPVHQIDGLTVCVGVIFVVTIAWFSLTFEYLVPDEIRDYIVFGMFGLMLVCLFDLRPRD